MAFATRIPKQSHISLDIYILCDIEWAYSNNKQKFEMNSISGSQIANPQSGASAASRNASLTNLPSEIPQQAQPGSVTIVSQQPNLILVSERQRGNPILRHIKNVKWEYCRKEMIPGDYAMNSTCALFVSVRYHTLHNSYIEARMSEIGKQLYRVRVLIVHVDDENNNNKALHELNRYCFLHDFTLILGWSDIECAR